MSDPVEHRLRRVHVSAWRPFGTVDHDHGQPQPPCGGNLGVGGRSTGILRHDRIDRLGAHQGKILLHIEGAACNNRMVVGKGWRLKKRVYGSQQIEVLRLFGEGLEVLPSYCEHNPFGGANQGLHSALDPAHARPPISRLRRPRRTRQRDQRHARLLAGLDGRGAHLGGKGVGCVHQMADRLVAKIVRKPRRPAKAPDARAQGQIARPLDPPGQRHGALDPLFVQALAEPRGLGRAAEDQEVGCHGG